MICYDWVAVPSELAAHCLQVVTVELVGFAATHGMRWHCTSWESPGLPDVYHVTAMRTAPSTFWEDTITTYLAAPNVVVSAVSMRQ